jgi:hypothetical protein
VRTDCEFSAEIVGKVVLGDSEVQLHSFFTSAWGAGEWSSSGTRYLQGRLGEPKSRTGLCGERQGRRCASGIASFVLRDEAWRSLKLRCHSADLCAEGQMSCS